MPGSISCAECRATVKKHDPNKEPNCDKCLKVRILPENMIVYDVIIKFSPIIWDGESISAYGISKALEWSYIDDEDFPMLARKLVIYFTEVKKQQYNKMKAQNVRKTFSKKGR